MQPGNEAKIIGVYSIYDWTSGLAGNETALAV